MSDYREPQSSGKLEWDLPKGYSVGSITLRLPISLPAYQVYITYEQMEMIEGRECRIATGMTGQGDDLNTAFSIALTKCEASLAKQRDERAMFIRNPKPQPVLRKESAGKGADIDISGLLDGLELKL